MVRSGIMPSWHLWTLAGAVILAVAFVVAQNRMPLGAQRG
jgi:hypothetical protein